jgi:hypothetical protein
LLILISVICVYSVRKTSFLDIFRRYSQKVVTLLDKIITYLESIFLIWQIHACAFLYLPPLIICKVCFFTFSERTNNTNMHNKKIDEIGNNTIKYNSIFTEYEISIITKTSFLPYHYFTVYLELSYEYVILLSIDKN